MRILHALTAQQRLRIVSEQLMCTAVSTVHCRRTNTLQLELSGPADQPSRTTGHNTRHEHTHPPTIKLIINSHH